MSPEPVPTRGVASDYLPPHESVRYCDECGAPLPPDEAECDQCD
jgi:predicted nucleic acid-binding Zn ribbon protein